MVTLLVYFLALLVVGALLFLLASFTFGRGEEMAPMPPDASPVVLPAARRVTGRDLHRLRLSVVVRGYRMGEVDWVLERLAREIDERDLEIARLRQEYGRPGEPLVPPTAATATDGADDVNDVADDTPHGRDGSGDPYDATDMTGGTDGDGRDGRTDEEPDAVRAARSAAGEAPRD